MLLRRITEHVKAQNWTAVGLDFVIVVVGVFIGIQVANWNDARAEEQREKEVLVEILDDLRTDHNILESAMAMAKLNIAASNYVLAAANMSPVEKITIPVDTVLGASEFIAPQPEPIPPEFKSQLWKRITIHYFPTQSDSAFDALVADGNLGLIADRDLVRDLQRYKLLWRSLEGTNNTTLHPLRDQTVFIGQRFGLSPFQEIDEQSLLALFDENPELVGAMRTLLEFTFLHHAQMVNAYQQCDELIQQIEEALK